MADRVHPAEPTDPSDSPKPLPEFNKPKPPPGSYVIQVPKDQVYRIPPPENARRFQNYVRRSTRRRSPCCCCLCWTIGVLLLLVVALAATAGILYLVFQPKAPSYSIQNLSVEGFNVSSNQALSPEFDVTVRADNPNPMIGFFYRGGSSVTVSYSGVDLCSGAWPVFYHGTKNVTVVRMPLKGSGIRLSGSVAGGLGADQRRGEVPLEIDVDVPVRVKFGAVTSWTITVKVRCDVTVDKLTAGSKVVSNSCSVKVDI